MKTGCSGKTMIRRLLLGFLLMCLVVMTGSKTTQAATTKYMKKLQGISWDLKVNKTIKFQTRFAGIGMHTQKVKITNWKITNTEDGYKKLTFKVYFDQRWSVSKSEVHKIAQSPMCQKTGKGGGLVSVQAVDYNTGANLMAKNNKYDVTVSWTDWEAKNTKCYRDSDGCFINLPTYTTVLTVIYPKNYKGLTIGITGTTKLDSTRGDKLFSKGKRPFGKTSYFDKKNKKVAHFMRVK